MLKAPLVIALPTDYRSRARDLAPDLWHVRATSVELESGRFPAPPSPDARRSAASGRDDFGARAASSVDAEAARAIPEDVLRSLSTWKHLFRHASPVQVDPWIGIETVDLWDDLLALYRRSFQDYVGLWAYFDGRGLFGHMSSAGNRLVAERIAQRLGR